MTNSTELKQEPKKKKKGCLIFIGIIVFIIAFIAIFIAVFKDEIDAHSDKTEKSVDNSITVIDEKFSKIQTLVESIEFNNELIRISGDMPKMEDLNILPCNYSKLIKFNANSSESDVIDQGLQYQLIEEYLSLRSEHQQDKNSLSKFDLEEIINKINKSTHLVVVRYNQFKQPTMNDNEWESTGIAEGFCILVDLDKEELLGYGPFSTTSSSEIDYEGGVDLRIKGIPIGSLNIGGDDLEEKVFEDFSNNITLSVENVISNIVGEVE